MGYVQRRRLPMELPQGLVVAEAPSQRRVPRSPSHPFFLQTRPFGIYPFMLAPVLPGETLTNLTLQSRVVTDPIYGPLIGWWKEYYFFYVPLRTMPATIAAAAEAMILNPSLDMTGVDGSTDSAPYYFAPAAGDAVNWAAACMESVVGAYFRDESETWNTQLNADGVPKCKFKSTDWSESFFTQAEVDAGDIALSDGSLVEMSDWEQKYRTFLLLRQQQMIDMTWEEYLGTFGVQVPGAGKNKPELIRYFSDWQYPSNTIVPTTGVPTSAVSWSIAGRADKNRFFTEPGFIFGVTVCRPKAYRATQKQFASVMLGDAISWMPAILKEDPSSSLKDFASTEVGTTPFSTNVAVDHVLDQRDLFVYGDQFVYAPEVSTSDAQGDVHLLDSVGDAHLTLHYPLDADINKLFVDRANSTKVRVREDGICLLNIQGTQVDMT